MSEVRARYMAKVDEILSVCERFTYHKPTAEQGEKYDEIRDCGLDFAGTILENCPPCPERDRAIDKLQEAVMLANAAVAIYGGENAE